MSRKIQRAVNKRRAMFGASAAVMVTAGGGCGFECRRERDEETYARLRREADELHALALRACTDQACMEQARALYYQLLSSLYDWYLMRAANDWKPSPESNDLLDVLRELLRDLARQLGNRVIADIPMSGVIEGGAEIVYVSVVPVPSEQLFVSVESSVPSNETAQSPSGVQVGEVTAVDAVSAVIEAAASSSAGTIIAERHARLRGQFNMGVDPGHFIPEGNYGFDYTLVIGSMRVINGLTVRGLSSGSVRMQGLPLEFVLDAEIGASQLIIGAGGTGILRLSGRFAATDGLEELPIDLPISIDLPVRQVTSTAFAIQSERSVDFTVMVNRPSAWYADYNGSGAIDASDRDLFISDLAASKAGTDLNADTVFDAADQVRFDDGSAAATARRDYLAQQGVGGLE